VERKLMQEGEHLGLCMTHIAVWRLAHGKWQRIRSHVEYLIISQYYIAGLILEFKEYLAGYDW